MWKLFVDNVLMNEKWELTNYRYPLVMRTDGTISVWSENKAILNGEQIDPARLRIEKEE